MAQVPSKFSLSFIFSVADQWWSSQWVTICQVLNVDRTCKLVLSSAVGGKWPLWDCGLLQDLWYCLKNYLGEHSNMSEIGCLKHFEAPLGIMWSLINWLKWCHLRQHLLGQKPNPVFYSQRSEDYKFDLQGVELQWGYQTFDHLCC